MKIKFLQPLANSKNFPAPTIKGLPSLSVGYLNMTTHKFNKKVINSGLFTQNARNGLALIGQQINLDKKHSILLPAYHCPALVEPFIALGVEIIFYKLNKDLSIDLEDFKDKIKDTTHACIIVRFFGFAKNLSEEIKLAKDSNLIVIEDWAHCYFGQLTTVSSNYTSDFAVSSCNKFFPSIDGGIVWKLSKPYPILSNFSWKDEISSFLSTFPYIWRIITFLKKMISKQKSICPPSQNEVNPDNYRYFIPKSINQSCMRLTKWIVKHSNYNKIIKNRQLNFQYLAQHLSNLPVGKPLYNQLDENVVPYVFPFILNDAKHFNEIKLKGLALFRWEELAESNCFISKYYREHLIQIPCHQSLSQADLENIVKTIKNLLP